MVRIIDRFGGPGQSGQVFETHKGLTTEADARRILAQWTTDSDRIEAQESTTWTDGSTCTPFLIITECGEPADVFAQLVTAPEAK